MAKILVIEDNVELSILIRDLLVAEEFDVMCCQDGCQGVAFTHKYKPDLILLDLMLPAGGGFYVLQNIKLSTLTKGIPIVVLTASKDQEHKKKAQEYQVDAYLEKPYDPKELVGVIKRYLPSK